MMKQIMTMLMALLTAACNAQENENKSITKNKMTVSWHFKNDRIHFEMAAPTSGWVTIGFNTKTGISGAYLLMGNVVKDKVNLVEYYTKSPGNYDPISKFGVNPQVENIEGKEQFRKTTIRFSLPTTSISKYQKDLSEGMKYYMIMAYSQEDDFQHHSIMRTSVNVKL
ncbi:DOMON domain-containing protein [Seonamhaeicola sp. ML3]|uniref:DOMON domain-containing protein n=1 Tax=Seonamhaeicola sp. ML3 TaxID=2937786 RepID=UPI00200D82AE|nr:DOMON domain-containing protein [Seonamhaeicola sp. ML3]